MTQLSSVDLSSVPPGWFVTTVGELFDVVGGGTPSTRNPRYWDGDIPWISSADIHGLNNIKPRRYVTPEAIEESATNLVPNGSIIVVTRVGLGKVAVANTPLCFSQDSQGLICRGDIVDTSYAVYYLSLATQIFDQISRGTTIAGVTKKQLLDLSFPLPPKFEQHRIVAEIEKQFTRLDAAVANLQRVQANLQRYKASVLKAACEGRLVPQEATLNPDYEPAAKLLERILAERRRKWEEDEWQNLVERAQKKVAQAHRKAAGLPHYIRDLQPDDWQHIPESEYRDYLPKNDKWKQKYEEPQPPDTDGLPELPEGWVWASVDHLAHNVQYGTSDKAREDNTGLPVLRMGNIADGELDYSDLKYMPGDWAETDTFLLHHGDILFNRTNSAELVGKTAVYKDTQPDAVFASYLIRVQLLNDYVPELLSYYINSLQGRLYITSVVSQQVGQANVNGTKLKNMPVPVPPLEEQRRIVDEIARRLSIVRVADNNTSSQLLRAARLRQSILKQAFSGKLVTQDPDDEPAEQLLERIKGGNHRQAARSRNSSSNAKPTDTTPIQQSLFDDVSDKRSGT